MCCSVRFPEEVSGGGGLPYRAGLWQEQCVYRGNGMEGRISAENGERETEQGAAGSEESGRKRLVLGEKVCEDVGSNAEGSCLVYSVYGEKKGDCIEIIRKKSYLCNW